MKVGTGSGGPVGAKAVDVLLMLAARPDVLLAEKRRAVGGRRRTHSKPFFVRTVPFLMKPQKM
jgi:hypothetical protein